MKQVAIVGGGVAGLAAAIRVAEAGWIPILIETRKRLGGRATSFDDPRSGRVLDNCQHVVMGCCSNLVDFYDRLGVLEKIEWHRETYWAAPPGRPEQLRPSMLPAPLHFSRSFIGLRFISKNAKVAIARAMFAIARLGITGRLGWRAQTFAAYRESLSQPQDAIDLFWEPIVVGACNLRCREVAAHLALKVVQDGFLAGTWNSAIGIATTDLRSLYDPAEAFIEGAGGSIQLGTSAMGIAYDGVRTTGVVTQDGMVNSAAVVAAIPPDRLAKLVSLPMRSADSRLQQLEKFTFSPIVGVHLFFESEVMCCAGEPLPHLVLPGRGTHWLFDKGRDANGLYHVHALISAADDWVDLDEEEIATRVLEDIHWALPGARGLEPVEVRSIKEKRATFRATPENEDLRPSTCPGISGGGSGVGITNLYLAGDYCDTGWPATMESAVRSGYEAAHALTGEGGVVPDVPSARLSRLLGIR